MIYGIINSVIRGKEYSIDIQIYDIEKAFDGLWLEDCLNDVFDSVSPDKRNDKLALLYEANRKNMVAVKTAVGLTDRVDIPNIVQQGGTWGPGLCSNSVDKLGKKCRDQDIHIYKYKNISKVLIFAMCDDLNGVAKCGLESVALNTFITAQIELKKLRFHVPDKQGKSKCHKMHVGKKHETCPILEVHGTVMEDVKFDTYLGDIISSDGRNTRNLKKRIGKGLGIISEIINILSVINLGEHYIEIAIMLRESLFLNGIITNSEIWYSITKEEMKELEDLDKTLLRKILRVPFSTPTEAYFLELGIIPIEAVLKMRRANYLHYLLSRKEDEMLFTFFITQWYNSTVGDWTEQLKLDLCDLNIPIDFEYIKSKSKLSFKRLVKIKTEEFAFGALIDKQNTHSKIKNIHYDELKLKNYFKIPALIFKWRVNMAPLGENFRGGEGNKVCPLCYCHLDNQSMIFQCEEIRKEMKITSKLEDIYSDKISIETARELTKIENVREKLKNENT